MSLWNGITYALTIFLTVINISKGSLDCECTSLDCQMEGRSSCVAEYACYSQYMTPNGNQILNRNSTVTRGCIDDSTPLLCENRRPQAFIGNWPVLHCCHESWCNKDVVPTPPTQIFMNNLDPEELEDSSSYYDYESNYYVDDELEMSSSRPRPSGTMNRMNILYIAVPVAGACILMGIIIFAIFVLRKQNAYTDEEYHAPYQYPQVTTNPHIQTREKTSQCCKERQCCYTDCERSSTGSETKLLVVQV